MRLQIVYQNRGFLTVEIMLAFSIFTLFTLSTFVLSSSVQRLKVWSVNELDKIAISTHEIENKVDLDITQYGNDTVIMSNKLFSVSQSDYIKSWGRNSCNQRVPFDPNQHEYFSQGIDIGQNISTDLEVRNSIVYLTADSSVSSTPDFYIIDTSIPSSPRIISSVNTGPGLSAIDIAGPYVYVAQASTVNQLQIIDIHDRYNPRLISQLKLPLPTPTTTAPFATSIFHYMNYIFLGTAKWNGAELSIIDVSNVLSPVVIGTFETNTLINDIYAKDNKVYLATSDEMQMRILDTSNINAPILLDSFTSSGWQTQEGKTLDYFEGNVSLGRTVGGFNVVTNHEIFTFSSTSVTLSKDIPGGVYGVIMRQPNIFLLTHAQGKEFQVFDSNLNNMLFHIALGNQAMKMVCDGSDFYFATGNSRAVSILMKNK